MDRSTANTIREKLDVYLQPLAKELGVQIKAGSGTYDDHNYTVKVSFTEENEDGEALTKDAQDFLYYAERGLHNLKKEWLFQEFVSQGERWKLVGMSPRSKKYPMLCEKLSSGKVFKLPLESVLFGFGQVVGD